MVSPPARGWSSMGDGRSSRLEGFPARAGMVPWRGEDDMDLPGFPRPRGDGPWNADHTIGTTRVSPPARGWSPAACRVVVDVSGFPANEIVLAAGTRHSTVSQGVSRTFAGRGKICNQLQI